MQAFGNEFISPVDLFDVVDFAFATCRKSGNEQRNPSSDVGRDHCGAPQGMFFVEADNRCPVRVAKDDLRSHVDQPVNKKKPAFEHFLMDQHTPFCLGGDHQENAEQVGVSPGHGASAIVRIDPSMKFSIS